MNRLGRGGARGGAGRPRGRWWGPRAGHWTIYGPTMEEIDRVAEMRKQTPTEVVNEILASALGVERPPRPGQ